MATGNNSASPQPRSHECSVPFLPHPSLSHLGQSIHFSPCLLLPSWASHLRPSGTAALVLFPTTHLYLEDSLCARPWPQLLTCIQSCNPHSGPMGAGAGVRVLSRRGPLKCGEVWSPQEVPDFLPWACQGVVGPTPPVVPLCPLSPRVTQPYKPSACECSRFIFGLWT